MDKFEPHIELREMIEWKSNNSIPSGWGNGYVHLPPDHKWYGCDYNTIDVDVHGGLTYSEWDDEEINWIIGFDTGHYGDDLDKWPKEKVLEETNRLLLQCKH